MYPGLKSREEVLRRLTAFADPHIILKYNPNLQEEAKARYELSRPSEYVHQSAWQDSDPVMTEHHDRMIFGTHICPDGRTLEYDDHSRLHFIVHEIAHMSCRRSCWDYEKHSPDLYGWAVGDEKLGSYLALEEMAAGFIGFIWMAKLDIILDCIYYDMGDEATSRRLNFPNKAIDLRLVKHLLNDDAPTKAWMLVDADLSPIYRMKGLNGDLNTSVLTNGVFSTYGTRFHELLGIVNHQGDIVGTISQEAIQRNAYELQHMFKLYDEDAEAFLRYLSC